MVELYQTIKYAVLDLLYTHSKFDCNNGHLISENKYKIYKCSTGKGQTPFFILTSPTKELQLGDNESCLKLMTKPELIEFFELNGYPDNFKTIEALAGGCKIPPRFEYDRKDENGKPVLESFNLRKTMFNIFDSITCCQLALPIKNEDMKMLLAGESEGKLKKEIGFYLSEGCEKDPKFLFWAKTRLVKVSDCLEDSWLEKYRGHALIVKNPKTGFTTFGQKCGEHRGYSSKASVRGFADAQGNIQHGVYHYKFGSVMLDQAEHYPELIMDVAMTFMENGMDTSQSAGRKITDRGSPAITVVLNAGREIATPNDMLQAFDKILSKLTTTPEASGSRYGLIITSNKLRIVKSKSFVSHDELQKNKLIVESLIESAIPKIKQIYYSPRIQKWLEQPLENYQKIISDLCESFSEQLLFGERAKIFWLDHAKSGYRHVRGVALESTIVDLLQKLLTADVITDDLEEEILERCEENLKTVISINLDSLREMVEITAKTQPMLREIIIERFEAICQIYVKIIVFVYALAVKEGKVRPEQFCILNQLDSTFHSIEEGVRNQLFGLGYGRGFSQVIHAFEKLTPEAKKEVSQELETKFGLELSYSSDQMIWVLRSRPDIIDLLGDYIQTTYISNSSMTSKTSKTDEGRDKYPSDDSHTSHTSLTEGKGVKNGGKSCGGVENE